jgi:hypothetical protein
MRKITTPIAVALFAATFFLSSFSSDPKPKTKDLAGIWEMQINNRPTGFLKIFGTGGDVTNVRLTPLGFVKTLSGSYEIQSDSTYIEKVEEHENAALNKTNVVLRYQMDNPNTLTISYTINNFQGKETYRRVPFTIIVN